MSIEHADRIIVNLKVLASLKPGDRVYTPVAGFEIAEASWYNTVARWVQRDNRWLNLDAIKTLIDDATRILNTYVMYASAPAAAGGGDEKYYPVPTPEQSKGFIKSIVCEMEAAARGLANLKQTYEADARMVAHVDVTLQKLEFEVGKAKLLLPVTKQTL